MAVTGLGIGSYLALGSGCIPKKAIEVEGTLFGRPIRTFVDNDLAKLMLTDQQDDRVQQFYATYRDKPLDTKTLAGIAGKYSTDVSTLYFLQKSYQRPENKKAQDLYISFLHQFSDGISKNDMQPLENYYVAFVPGMNYNDTTNGGNFARQRKLLTAGGIKNEMIVTDDWGYTDDNAVIIAGRLRELSSTYNNIIVVSASKGGLETAVALGKILRPGEARSIRAWVSVGGILRGSPVADTYLHWPKCWIAGIGLMTKRKNINLVRDVSYKKRTVAYEQLIFPPHIKRIHFVGAPLATQINKRIKSLYCSIKEFGPNDGLTPLADEVTENGIVVSELGLDHHYKHPDIDKKTIALALVVTQVLN